MAMNSQPRVLLRSLSAATNKLSCLRKIWGSVTNDCVGRTQLTLFISTVCFLNIPSWESRSRPAVAQILCWEPNDFLFLKLSVFISSVFKYKWKPFPGWDWERTCVSTVCGRQCVCVCVLSVIVLPCAESLHEVEYSRIWRKLSGPGYCRKSVLC